MKFVSGFIFIFVVLTSSLWAQKYFPEKDPVAAQKIEQWRDLKFGLLMHWGAYSQWGIVESWSICPEDYGWCERKMGLDPNHYFRYLKQYESLPSTFNPVLFNPEKWAKAAKQAGMRYVIFTTKHHDGFCMFDSKYTDYKVTAPMCPFHRNPRANITKEIFKAFRQEGFWVGAYFSKPDWHSEYYWDPYFPPFDRNVNYDPEAYPEKWEKFVQFTHNQILELLTDYGPVDILWLDGGWVSKKSPEEIKKYYALKVERTSSGFIKNRIVNQVIRMDELVAKARAIQPGVIVVDRAVEGPHQNYLTPENTIPKKIIPYPWESCIIAGGGWAWVPNARYKPAAEVIGILINIVSKGGSLLLNIGPSPYGEFDKGAYQLLEEVGKWMKVNGEAIYATRAYKVFKGGDVWYAMKKDGRTLYAFILDEQKSGTLPTHVTLENVKIPKKATLQLLGSQQPLTWQKKGSKVVVTIPEAVRQQPPCQHAWTIRIPLK